jgi:hypothetical protein
MVIPPASSLLIAWICADLAEYSGVYFVRIGNAVEKISVE